MILLIGDLDREEFRTLRPALEACAPCLVAQCPAQAVTALEAACNRASAGPLEPVWIVLAQAYPGQFSPDEVERLRRAAPLAPVVVIEGPWSAGPWRSGRPLAGVHRVSWVEAARQISDEWNRFCLGQATGAVCMLPATASDEERVLAAAQLPVVRRQGQVVIGTPQAACYEWISAICQHGGYATVWSRPGQRLRLDGPWKAIFDADGWEESLESRWAELRTLAAQVRGGPVVVLAGQPRPEDCQHALAAGGTAVLNKPVAVEALLTALTP